MKRPGAILLLAVVLGAFSAALIFRQFRALQDELTALREAPRNGAPMVQLVVANDTIPIGSQIETEQVQMVTWPAEHAPEGAFSEVAAVRGSVARTTIQKGQPIVASLVSRDTAGLLPLLIADGMRGMSVKVDNVTGVSGFITPNSRVDVFATGSPESDGGKDERSKLILQNVRVLATGTSIEERGKDKKPIEVPTVTLLVSPLDAERLTVATAGQQPVRLALRNFRDEQTVSTPGTSIRQLLTPVREAPPPRAPARAKPAGPRVAPGYAVDILLGERLTQQILSPGGES